MTKILSESINDDLNIVWEGEHYLLSKEDGPDGFYIIWLKELNYLTRMGRLANRTEEQAIYEVKTFFEENKYAN